MQHVPKVTQKRLELLIYSPHCLLFSVQNITKKSDIMVVNPHKQKAVIKRTHPIVNLNNELLGLVRLKRLTNKYIYLRKIKSLNSELKVASV